MGNREHGRDDHAAAVRRAVAVAVVELDAVCRGAAEEGQRAGRQADVAVAHHGRDVELAQQAADADAFQQVADRRRLQLVDILLVQRGHRLRRVQRDLLDTALRGAGLVTHRVEGTYFLTADIRGVSPDGDGMAFCRSMPERYGVVAIPAGVLYSPANQSEGRHIVRLAFCKQLPTITAAAERLSAGK